MRIKPYIILTVILLNISCRQPHSIFMFILSIILFYKHMLSHHKTIIIIKLHIKIIFRGSLSTVTSIVCRTILHAAVTCIISGCICLYTANSSLPCFRIIHSRTNDNRISFIKTPYIRLTDCSFDTIITYCKNCHIRRII